jgi:hypothetical protein
MMERHHKMEHIQRDHFMLPKLAWKSDELRMEQSVFGIKVRVLLCEGRVCTAMYVCALCFAREAAVSVAACLTPLCVSIFEYAPTAQHIHRTHNTLSHPMFCPTSQLPKTFALEMEHAAYSALHDSFLGGVHGATMGARMSMGVRERGMVTQVLPLARRGGRR